MNKRSPLCRMETAKVRSCLDPRELPSVLFASRRALMCKASSRVGDIFDASGWPTNVLIWLGSCPEFLPGSHIGRIMVQRLRVFVFLACAAIEGAHAFQATAQTGGRQSPQDHLAWVAQVLKRMQTIRPGMTREKLLTIFTTEGGLSTPLERTFVSRDCPYFKVDVEFQAVGRPTRDSDGRVRSVEGSQDIILKISQPFLQFMIAD